MATLGVERSQFHFVASSSPQISVCNKSPEKNEDKPQQDTSNEAARAVAVIFGASGSKAQTHRGGIRQNHSANSASGGAAERNL